MNEAFTKMEKFDKMEKTPSFRSGFSHRNLLYQYIATATGTLAVLVSGMHFGWPSPSLPQLLSPDSPIPTTSSEGAWVAVMPCIGAPPGAILGATLVDRIGRKGCLLIVSPVFFLSWLAIAYAPNLIILNITRFVVGMADGMTFTVLPMYLGEISHPRIRGLLGSSMSVIFVFGFLVINTIGLFCSIKTTALISSILPVIHFMTFFWMPESPYFYIMKQKYEKAASSLKILTRSENVDEEIRVLSSAVKTETKGSQRFTQLFTQRNIRQALIIVLTLRLIQQFSGNYTIAFYCLIIFNEAGGSISGNIATLLYFCVQLGGSLLSCILVDKTGRRPLLIISAAGSGLALIVQGIYFYLKRETDMDMSTLGFLPLTALLLYNILFNIGLSTIPILVLGEFFPTEVKAICLCLADIFYGGIIVVALKFFQIVNDSIGMYVPFFTFALCCGLGLIFIIFCVPETKGKTLEQIQNELKGIKPNRSPSGTELKDVQVALLNDKLPNKSYC